MGLDDIPLFAMLQGKMAYAGARQKVVGENVANASTPGYTPRDLKPFTFADALKGSGDLGGVDMARTSGAHFEGRPVARPTIWKPGASPDSETTLDGNQVVLEEQMMKMTEARTDYDAAVSLYQKSLSMLRTAARRPGG